MAFNCAIYGQEHGGLPHIGSTASIHWADALAQAPKSFSADDLCIIEGRDGFVHGLIGIPVHDYKHEFACGVSVSHKKENGEICRAQFHPATGGLFFGWPATKIDFYGQPRLELKAMAHYQGGGLRPRIVLEESLPPLAPDQRDGASAAEAWEMVHHYGGEAQTGRGALLRTFSSAQSLGAVVTMGRNVYNCGHPPAVVSPSFGES